MDKLFDSEFCNHQCQLHERLQDTVDKHEKTLNGEGTVPGIIGKLDNVSKTVDDIKALLKWTLGLVLTPFILAIVALVIKGVSK